MARNKKLAPCPTCCPAPGRACFTAEEKFAYDAPTESERVWTQVWRCENCGHELLRTRRARVELTAPNGAQRAAVERLKAQVIACWGSTVRSGEWKREDVTMVGDRAFVLLEYGMVGDEGTAAAVFCRHRYHVAIGPRGRIEPCGWTGPKSAMPIGAFKVALHGTEYKAKWWP